MSISLRQTLAQLATHTHGYYDPAFGLATYQDFLSSRVNMRICSCHSGTLTSRHRVLFPPDRRITPSWNMPGDVAAFGVEFGGFESLGDQGSGTGFSPKQRSS